MGKKKEGKKTPNVDHYGNLPSKSNRRCNYPPLPGVILQHQIVRLLSSGFLVSYSFFFFFFTFSASSLLHEHRHVVHACATSHFCLHLAKQDQVIVMPMQGADIRHRYLWIYHCPKPYPPLHTPEVSLSCEAIDLVPPQCPFTSFCLCFQRVFLTVSKKT